MKPLLAALIVCVAAACAIAIEDAPKIDGELAKLQGKWSAMVGPNRDLPAVTEITKDEIKTVVTTPDNGDITIKGKIKLDEKAKPHKTIDWIELTLADGNEIPTIKGIYEIKDGELKICSGPPGGDRAAEFKEGNGPGTTTTWKKVKAKDDEKKKDAK